MVCNDCQKKLPRVATQDTWKAGSRNTIESGGRKIGENKALRARANRFAPTTSLKKCKICNAKLHLQNAHYCQECSYKKAICAMCGKKLYKTKNYKQSAV